MREVFEPIDFSVDMDHVVDVLKSSGAEVMVNLLPVGSEETTRFYARASLKAEAAFINAIPAFIASDPSGLWQRLYREAGLPLLGDDVKGQVGATILHRTLIKLLHMRDVIAGPSAYLFKHLPMHAVDGETAYRWFVDYIEKGVNIGDSRGSKR